MNILITGAWNQAKENIPQIENMGHKIIFTQQEQDPLPCEYSWPEVTICNNLFQYHNIEKFKNLKFIQSTAAGLDRMPMEYITENNIKLNVSKTCIASLLQNL